MSVRHPNRGAPRGWHSLLELRALGEAALLPWMWPALSRLPRGDGQPVLLLPGFMANEHSLVAMKRLLKRLGYEVHTWGLGRNVGFQRRHAQAVEQKIRHLHHVSGRTVSLVGWSLGGVFALYGAHQAPECVRQIITLGSPVSLSHEGSQSPPFVQALYRVIAHPMGPRAHANQPHARKLREGVLPELPISCLYSVSDGVVPPQEATIDGNAALHENIRVAGSHVGLGFNAMVLAIVADRLAVPEGGWRPFEPTGAGGMAYRMMTHPALPV